MLSEDHQLDGYDLPPSQALIVPTHATISSRWPGMSHDEMEVLEKDYRLESRKLEDLDLDDVYHRVKEIVVHDAM